MLLLTLSTGAHLAEVNIPTLGRTLYVSFDLTPTAWWCQSDVYDPNLISLEYRGGISLSPNSDVTGTLLLGGVSLASTTADFNCSLCSDGSLTERDP
jgi:hypothetical protein